MKERTVLNKSHYTCLRIWLILTLLTALILPAVASNGIPPEVVKYANDWPLPNQDYSNSRAAVNSTIIVYVPILDWYGDWSPTGFIASSLNISQAKGELAAINVSRGKILWYHKLDSMEFGAATVVNDLVFTATFDGNIYAFKRHTGERVWKHTAPAGINGWPAVAGDTIIWPSGVGKPPLLIALRIGASGNGSSPQIMIISPRPI